MIPRYNDLAANERTYLAWIRTSLALIAFGFVLERFDLILRTFVKTMHEGQIQIPSSAGREAGITLVVVGLVIMLSSTARFITTTRRIQSETTESYGFNSVLILGGVFIMLAIFVLLYVTQIITIM
jgi:putative membrane protein